MRLREFFCLREEEGDDASTGVPEPIDADAFQRTTPMKTSPFRSQPGAGPLSSGVPEPLDGGDSGAFFNPKAKGSPAPGKSVRMAPERPGSKTEPLMNWQPPPGAFTSSPAPSPKRPVSSPSSPAPGLKQVGPRAKTAMIPRSSPPAASQAVHPWMAGTGDVSSGVPEPVGDREENEGLREFFALDEMPRPKGTFSPALRAALDWASRQTGEFSGREMFRAWRDAGGQPNQPNDTTAYQSFLMLLKKLIAPEGRRPSDQQPLVITKIGQRGDNRYPTIYKWGLRGKGPAPTAQSQQVQAPAPADDDFGQEEPTQPDASPFQQQVEPEPEDDDIGMEDEPAPAKMGPSWLPTPEPDGAGAEYAMSFLSDQGLGPTSQLWRDVARGVQMGDDGTIMQALRNYKPNQFMKQKLLVTRYIAQQLGKPIDL